MRAATSACGTRSCASERSKNGGAEVRIFTVLDRKGNVLDKGPLVLSIGGRRDKVRWARRHEWTAKAKAPKRMRPMRAATSACGTRSCAYGSGP
jgi:hypothetical protein